MKFNKIAGVATVLLTIALLFFVGMHLSSNPARASRRATPIKLHTLATAALDDVLNGPNENNLANLPTGRQVLAGVPFEISGIVHVSGKALEQWGGRKYPVAVNDIPVNKRCNRLFLLQGVGGALDPDGTTIGKLVLHYGDNSVQELKFNLGEHTRDWWGDPKQPLFRQGGELAWTGVNPAIQKFSPGGSLRLYKSTFTNPQPNITIVSVDYVSMMRESAPFMVGMTVD